MAGDGGRCTCMVISRASRTRHGSSSPPRNHLGGEIDDHKDVRRCEKAGDMDEARQLEPPKEPHVSSHFQWT